MLRLTTLLLAFVACLTTGAQGAQTFAERLRLLKSPTPTDYVWVAAHRADWQYAPENSMQALRNAIDFGVDIIETDVQMTKDRHFIMMHDNSVDRTTTGHGKVADLTLSEIQTLYLRTNWGQSTDQRVPTLEEYLVTAQGKVCLYLDKAGNELPGEESGTRVKALLEVLRKHNALEQTIFVLDWPYAKAKRIFGQDLERVIFCPVIKDGMPDMDAYVDEYLEKLHPVAFQFRMAGLDTGVYAQLPKVKAAGSKAFVAATWPKHTAGHDDMVSLFQRPSQGWGWLIDQGFNILETNYSKDLIHYLKSERRH